MQDAFLTCFDSAIASSINDALPLITKEFHLSSTQKGNVVSILLLGAVVGSLCAGAFFALPPVLLCSTDSRRGR